MQKLFQLCRNLYSFAVHGAKAKYHQTILHGIIHVCIHAFVVAILQDVGCISFKTTKIYSNYVKLKSLVSHIAPTYIPSILLFT